jgi:hypothetical protein
MKIHVKYTDSGGAKRGPFSFTFDLDRLFLDETKKALSDDMPGYKVPWFNVAREGQSTHIALNPYQFDETARAGIEKILYGLDQRTPNARWPLGEARVTTGKNVRYISAQVVFKDGASTDVRIFDGF